MTDADTEAREIITGFFVRWATADDTQSASDYLEGAIATALRARETQTVEACAKVAENYGQLGAYDNRGTVIAVGASISARIRALAPLTPGGERTP